MLCSKTTFPCAKETDMKRTHSIFSNEPLVILILTLLWNQLVYCGARLIAGGWQHYDLTTAADQKIPFLPWTVVIYFGCYLFWCINYYLCAAQTNFRHFAKPDQLTAQSVSERNRFFCADALSKAICLFFFLVLPTTNVRPEITGTGLWAFLMRFLYQVDAADNLFPSIHCLVSWLCWIGVRRRRDLPAFYRWFSLLAAIAVCLSTLTTRQHVLADVFSGVFLAEFCYLIAGFPCICQLYSRFLQWILDKVLI